MQEVTENLKERMNWIGGVLVRWDMGNLTNYINKM